MVRHIIGVAAGAVVTLGLLWLMRSVIANPKAAADSGLKGHVLDFVHVQEDQEIETNRRLVEPPPPPIEPPPNMPKPSFDDNVSSIGVDVGIVPMEQNINLSDSGGFSSDGEYLPIVKVQPIYPRRALERSIEGYVILEFVVTATGSVRDPVVIEAKPSSVFNRAAIQAALKFKYKPKVVNGEPIEVAGVRNRIKFELQE